MLRPNSSAYVVSMMARCKYVQKIRKNLVGCIRLLFSSLECIHKRGKRSISVNLCTNLLLFFFHNLNHSHCLFSTYISVQSFCLLVGIHPGFCNVFTSTVVRSARGPRPTVFALLHHFICLECHSNRILLAKDTDRGLKERSTPETR